MKITTGLMRNMRSNGKFVVTVHATRGCRGYLPVGDDGRTWTASFIGWGSSLAGSGRTREEALADLERVSGVGMEKCEVRDHY